MNNDIELGIRIASSEAERSIREKQDQINRLTKDIAISHARYMRIKEKYLRAIDILNQVKNDDGGRYNRPSYYYDVCKFLGKENIND